MDEWLPDTQLFTIKVVDEHFVDVIHVLTRGTMLVEYSVQKKKELVEHATYFILIAVQLYKLGVDDILKRYVLEHERQDILVESLGGVARGHYAGKSIAQKVLHARLWWPTLYNDSLAYCRTCDSCQRTGKPLHREKITLYPQMAL